MNKALYERLNLFVSLIRLDFREFSGKIELTVALPSYIKFDSDQNKLNVEAMNGWYFETIKPVTTSLSDTFRGRLVNEDLRKQALDKLKEIERVMAHAGVKSIKDQLRERLGLMPYLFNVEKGKG